MEIIDLCIIGAGEVVRERYSLGLAATRNLSRFRVSWIYDILPVSEVSLTLQKFPSAVYTQIPRSVSEAVHLIIQEVPPSAVVIIATPVQFHIPYAIQMLGKFRLIAVEKPLTNSQEEYAIFESLTDQINQSYFLLSYYLIEKALPYLIFCCPDFHVKPYIDLIEPIIEPELLSELHKELGLPQKLVACILESVGFAGSLDNRSWVLTPEAGGNTWETLFHLTCLVSVGFKNASRRFTILQSYRGVVNEISSMFNNQLPQDTANLVHLKTDEISAIIFAAKYLHSKSHQRWLKLECQGGEMVIDFSSTVLTVETKSYKIQYQLSDPTPYATQFFILSEMLENSAIPFPQKVYTEGFMLNAQIYEFSQRFRPELYEKGLSAKVLANSLGADNNLGFLWETPYNLPRIKA
ncbi:hypothetical protein G7B40_021750 [Aetokthonos hydrillicola Thurmond2011]|jgi:hypothetical protein|uniref:Uncharacterized protein n=1 Tax=Aetokthonos hydrillicola Thurmond2011 TaxID=2712845 RepID=A0AAP5MBI4_9CYAN|nr:hypothetical protein [Aetokthonos hydrillicola]MBO3457794.1 hypothetical protein [Aetokthonos hydrillicola CCALA 1050]MBW4588348.1 hypothetical protein [Aetokthonos hydrillicola CCALA 1050]MDR9897168.1 hypothetical protein [Aetokthonos hydrillicola Thurmond2011]